MTALRRLGVPDTAALFPRLHAHLISLLRALQDEEWALPTLAPAWRVRDVAMHLLDGDLRKLSAHRDGHLLAPDSPVQGYGDVLALINSLNARGVEYGRRLSPRVLTDLLELTGRWVSDFVATLDADAPALFPVGWAGEDSSTNRFDTAREYTERWHHQMQIRHSVGSRTGGVTFPDVLLATEYLLPLLDTSAQVLPHAYRHVAAPDGTSVVITAAEGQWACTLRRDQGGWSLHAGNDPNASARAALPANMLWQHFFNALPADVERHAFFTEGDRKLLEPFWSARSVMV